MTTAATGTWTTAHLAALGAADDVLPFFPQPRTFTGATVRQPVRLRRGGAAVRLVVSNEFGRAPLTFDRVAVDGVAALLDGRGRWEIPLGATATSDPVPHAVVAGAELVVDVFVASTAAGSTSLHSAQRTGAVAPGDQVGAPELRDAQPFASQFWISRVLVDTPAAGPVVVCLGDSVTRGDATTEDADQRYPDHLQRRFDAAGIPAAVLNAGIGGNRLLRGTVGPAIVDRFDRDVLGTAEATHVIVMAGLNDLALPSEVGEPGRPSAAEIVAGLLGVARRAAAHGVAPVLATITPIAGSIIPSFLAPGNLELRAAVNAALLGRREWPVVDLAAALGDPAAPDRLASANDSGDGVHPSDAGARALAEAIPLHVFARRRQGVPG